MLKELTKERVLEAARTCPEAKKALMILFPEAFGDPYHYEKLGSRFYITSSLVKKEYILAESKGGATLINIYTGRMCSPTLTANITYRSDGFYQIPKDFEGVIIKRKPKQNRLINYDD
jgi:hypothetical protein